MYSEGEAKPVWLFIFWPYTDLVMVKHRDALIIFLPWAPRCPGTALTERPPGVCETAIHSLDKVFKKCPTNNTLTVKSDITLARVHVLFGYNKSNHGGNHLIYVKLLISLVNHLQSGKWRLLANKKGLIDV